MKHVYTGMLTSALVALALVFFLPSAFSLAQSNSSSWIYAVAQDEVNFYLIRTDASQAASETIATIPMETTETFRSFVPATEIEAATTFLEETGEDADYIAAILASTMVVNLDHMVVAPNNNSIAVVVRYETCTRFQNYACFGVSKILIYTEPTVAPIVVFSANYHQSPYIEDYSPELVRNVQVDRIDWLSNGNTLLVQISDENVRREVYRGRPLLAIPLSNTVPMVIGSFSAWEARPDLPEVAALHSQTLTRLTLDSDSQTLTHIDISLAPYTPNPFNGIAFSGDAIVFNSLPLNEGSVPAGITVYNNNTVVALSSDNIGIVSSFETLPEQSGFVIRNQDGILWQAQIVDGVLETEVLTTTPVGYWNVGGNGQLLVQFQGQIDYTILSLENNLVQPQALGATSMGSVFQQLNMELVEVDW